MAVRREGDPKLSPIEWKAVSFAFQEAQRAGCGDIEPAGRLRRIGSRISRGATGSGVRPALADPKLETLRRFVCTTRRKGRAADEFSPALAAAGFNPAQIKALELLSAT